MGSALLYSQCEYLHHETPAALPPPLSLHRRLNDCSENKKPTAAVKLSKLLKSNNYAMPKWQCECCGEIHLRTTNPQAANYLDRFQSLLSNHSAVIKQQEHSSHCSPRNVKIVLWVRIWLCSQQSQTEHNPWWEWKMAIFIQLKVRNKLSNVKKMMSHRKCFFPFGTVSYEELCVFKDHTGVYVQLKHAAWSYSQQNLDSAVVLIPTP